MNSIEYTLKLNQEELNLLATAVANVEGGILKEAAKCGKYDIADAHDMFQRLNVMVG